MLLKIFFKSPFSSWVSIDQISKKLGVPTCETMTLISDLVKYKAIDWNSFDCPSCGYNITKAILVCPSCNKDISENWKFYINGCLEEDQQKEYSNFAASKTTADNFSQQWIRQGHIYYLIIDVVESENLQEQDSLQYNAFLDKIRFLIKNRVLSQTKRKTICLGEIGDCIKIAFLSVDDAIKTMEKLAKIILEENFEQQFYPIRGIEASPFPRFDGTLGKISISDKHKELENIFCITLTGALDFNDYELTCLFRFDQKIKTTRSIFEKNTIISLWIQNEVIKALNWEGIPEVLIEAESHGSVKKSNFSLLAFTGIESDPYRSIKNPDIYLKKKCN